MPIKRVTLQLVKIPIGQGANMVAETSQGVTHSRSRFSATELTSVVVAMIACLGAIVSAFYSYANRNRELDIKLVEVGLSILRADPKETQTNGAREWAIKIVETYSGQAFSEEAKKELLNRKLIDVPAKAASIVVPGSNPGNNIRCFFNPATGTYDQCHAESK
jgi:hypothetical protein